MNPLDPLFDSAAQGLAPAMSRRKLIAVLASLGGAAVLSSCGQSTRTGGTVSGSSAVPYAAPVPSSSTAAPVSSSSTTLRVSDASTPAVPETSPPTDAGRVAGGPATYVNHGARDRDLVALTFHLGGDPDLAHELLDLLIRQGVPATFFAIGSWITANPDITRHAVDAEFELANHTANHLSMGDLSAHEVSSEIVQGGLALVPFIGSIGKWFRPSGTDVPDQTILDEAGRAGYPISVGYDVDSRDYQEPGADAVVANATIDLHPGAIVSLHFGHRDTIAALPRILDHLAASGLAPVTIGQLLG